VGVRWGLECTLFRSDTGNSRRTQAYAMSDTFSKVEVITCVTRRRRFSTDMRFSTDIKRAVD
jgi:hypothetical protein